MDRRLRAGEVVRAEDYLADGGIDDADDALELVYTEFVCREELGSVPEPAEYLARFPGLRPQLEEQFLVHRALADGPIGGQAVGPYDLIRELGRGGRGVVFAARDRRDGRPVAVKLLLSGEYSTPDELALFRHEAAALTRLDHPHLIRIYEASEADGRPYLALEPVDGPPLSRAMADFRDPAAAAGLVETLARAIHHAHSQGVVHRDLKPSNVLLAGARGEERGASQNPSSLDPRPSTLDPRPKITDFGLARLLDGASARTRTGDIVGTLGYMAPEQAAGTAHRAGPAADVYALGAILYELLTGAPPFGPDPSAVSLHRLLHEPPIPPRRRNPAIPRDLETAVLTCLEKRADDRYPTALALADDLRRCLDGRPVAARRVGAAEALRRWAVRRPAVAALLAVVLVAAGGLLVGGLHYNVRLRDALGESEGLRRQTATANADLTAALADADALRADTRRQLDDTRRVLYAMQLSQLPSLWPREPVRARQLLTDEKGCPPDLRDFTWRHFRGLCSLDERTRVNAHPGGTRAVAVLPDGRWVSAGADGTVQTWPPSGSGPSNEPKPIAAHAGAIRGLAVVGDRTFATAGQDRTVKVWPIDGTTPLRTFAVPAEIHALAASRSAGLLAAACDGGAVRVWSAESGRELVTLTGASPASALAFAPDGRTLAAGERDGAVRVWDLATAAVTAVWDAKSGAILGLAFAPDGTFVVSTGERGGVTMWRVRDGVSRDLRGHLLAARAAAVSPAGDRVATGGDDTYLKVWDATSGQELTNLMGMHVTAVAWSPDGNGLAAGGKDGRVSTYRLPRVSTPVAHAHPANVGTLVTRPEGGVVTADAAGVVRIWDAGGAVPAATFTVRPHDPGPPRPQAVVGAGAPALAVSTDGATLAVGAGGGEIVLWDLVRRTEVTRLTGHDGNVSAVAFRPGGTVLATGGADQTVRIWDVPGRKPISIWKEHSRGVLTVAWSPTGDRLASGGEDNAIRLWDPDMGRSGPPLTGHSLWVLNLAFHPNGKTLASGGRDRTVRLWDVEGTRPPVVLTGYTNWVYSVGFSPDGRTLATASGHYSIDSPGEVKLCDPDAGYVRAILTDVRAPAAFDATATKLYVGVRGGVAELVGR